MRPLNESQRGKDHPLRQRGITSVAEDVSHGVMAESAHLIGIPKYPLNAVCPQLNLLTSLNPYGRLRSWRCCFLFNRGFVQMKSSSLCLGEGRFIVTLCTAVFYLLTELFEAPAELSG